MSDYTGDGTGKNKTAYAPRERFYDGNNAKTSFTPKLTCNNNDLYTIPNSSNVGNKAMTQKTTSGNYVPVGLITADEAGIVGLLYSIGEREESSYVTAGSSSYWTMSPFSANGSGVGDMDGVRPVINVNLDKIKIMTGTGASGSRFVIT